MGPVLNDRIHTALNTFSLRPVRLLFTVRTTPFCQMRSQIEKKFVETGLIGSIGSIGWVGWIGWIGNSDSRFAPF